MSRSGSRLPFLPGSSVFPRVRSREESLRSSAVDAGVPVQEVWTPDGPPAPLPEGSAQEPPLVGDRRDGSDHSPAGRSERSETDVPGGWKGGSEPRPRT